GFPWLMTSPTTATIDPVLRKRGVGHQGKGPRPRRYARAREAAEPTGRAQDRKREWRLRAWSPPDTPWPHRDAQPCIPEQMAAERSHVVPCRSPRPRHPDEPLPIEWDLLEWVDRVCDPW